MGKKELIKRKKKGIMTGKKREKPCEKRHLAQRNMAGTNILHEREK